MWLVAMDLFLIAWCVTWGAGFARRSHFWTRVLLCCLVLPALLVAVAHLWPDHVASRVGMFVLLAALIAAPVASCKRPMPQSDPPGGADNGGPGPNRPVGPPDPPRGEVPLPDADPSPVRVRDHRSPQIPRLRRWREREPQHEPIPAPPSQ